jgi:GAF domain-containing protein
MSAIDPKRTLVGRLNKPLSPFSGTGLSGYALGLGAAMRRRTKKGGKARARSRTTRHNAPTTARLLAKQTDVAQFTRERDEALEQLSATSKVLKVISRSTYNLQTVLDTVVEAVTRLCEAYDSVVFLRQGERLHVKAHYGPILLDFGDGPIGRGWVTGRAFVDRLPIHVYDLQNSARDFPDGSKMALRTEVRTTLSVPLLTEDEVIGALTIRRNEVKPFTERQVELVNTFAAQAVIAIENTRLLNELRESLQQQTATADVLKAISRSTFDLQTVLNTLTESAAGLCEADVAAIIRQKGTANYWATSYGLPPEHSDRVKSLPIVPGRGTVVARVLLEGHTVHVRDVLADPEYTFFEAQKIVGFRTALGVPLLREGSPIGVLALMRCSVRPFTDKQVELVETFADQAVIAIENVRLFDEVQARTRELTESLQQQTATADVLKVISSSPGDLEPVFQAMLEKATQLCEAKFGVMFRFADGVFRATSWLGNPPAYIVEQPHVVSENPHNLLTRIVSTKQPVYSSDLTKERAYIEGNPRYVALVEAVGARSLLVVPMVKNEELIGAIAIYWQEARSFTEKQMELISNFAAQAVIAIDNARLLSELRESLQQQTATADVLKVISRSTFDLQAVLDTLVKSAASLCEADQSFLYRRDGEKYVWAASHGYSPEFVNLRTSQPLVPDRGTGVGRAIVESKTVHIPDVLEDKEYSAWDLQQVAGYRAVLGVPLLREGVSMGVFSLSRKDPRSFTDKQIELLTMFADQAAIAMENVRLFESVEMRTRELAKSLEDLRTTQDRLVQTQKLASLGQLTAGIAHEIKNPLNFVNNFSGVSAELIGELQETLKDLSLNEKRRSEIAELMDTLRSNLDKVVQHGKRADAIVKNMLLHSHQGSGEHRPVAINTIVEESLKLAYHGARAEKQNFNIMVEQSLDPVAGEVDVFPQEITRVLLNLISNGVYATREKTPRNSEIYRPTLTASTKNLGDRVEIKIRDNGIGIPPEVKDKMFNPFFTTKPAGEGTGLGLSISHDIIVKQHAGSIEVDTQPGEFTEVRIVLPRTAASISK